MKYTQHLANQSMHYISYKHNAYNTGIICIVPAYNNAEEILKSAGIQ